MVQNGFDMAVLEATDIVVGCSAVEQRAVPMWVIRVIGRRVAQSCFELYAPYCSLRLPIFAHVQAIDRWQDPQNSQNP